MCVSFLFILTILLPNIHTFSSYRNPQDVSTASSYGCECSPNGHGGWGYASAHSEKDDTLVTLGFVMGAIGFLTVAAAAFGALYLALEQAGKRSFDILLPG